MKRRDGFVTGCACEKWGCPKTIRLSKPGTWTCSMCLANLCRHHRAYAEPTASPACWLEWSDDTLRRAVAAGVLLFTLVLFVGCGGTQPCPEKSQLPDGGCNMGGLIATCLAAKDCKHPDPDPPEP